MAWVADVLDDPDFEQLRSDRRRNWAEVVRVLARYVDWRDRTTRPTWARVADQARVSRRTVARAIEWLHARGYLGTVETGSTPLFRIGVLYGLATTSEGNRAAEYVLCTPGRPTDRRPIRQRPTRPVSVCPSRSGTPSGSRKGPRRIPPREDRAEGLSARHWPATQRPGTRGEALAAAETLRRRNPMLRRLTARHLRSLAKLYFEAGWTPADVLYAMEHRPDGRQHPHTHSVRHVPGWLRYRLTAWRAPHGGLYATPGQLAADYARRIRAEQMHRAAKRAAALAARADSARFAAAVRDQLPAAARARHRAAQHAALVGPARFAAAPSQHGAPTAPAGRRPRPRRPVSPPVVVRPGRDCTRCGTALDPDGTCFVCNARLGRFT